jgi:hypothetical protein
MNVYEVLKIFSEVSSQLQGNFKLIFEKIPEDQFEDFAQSLGIGEQQYKFLLSFLSKNWDVLGSRTKGEIFTDLQEVLKVYLTKNDVASLKNLSLRTLNQYKGVKKELSPGEKGFKVIKITDIDQCVRLTTDSGWCVQKEDYAAGYLKNGPLYLIVKDGKRLALLQPETGSYMDVYDNPLGSQSLLFILNGISGSNEYYEILEKIGKSIELASEGSVFLDLDESIDLNIIKLLIDRSAISVKALLHIVVSDQFSYVRTKLNNSERFKIIDYLLEAGVDLNKPILEKPLLSIYIDTQIPSLVDGLLQRGLDPNINYEYEGYFCNPLLQVVTFFSDTSTACLEILELLLKYGADPNTPVLGQLPLIESARLGYYEFCVRLINAGADPNVTDSSRNTSLHHIASLGNNFLKNSKEIVKLLLENGARIDIPNNDGLTPIDVANEYETVGFINAIRSLFTQV